MSTALLFVFSLIFSRSSFFLSKTALLAAGDIFKKIMLFEYDIRSGSSSKFNVSLIESMTATRNNISSNSLLLNLEKKLLILNMVVDLRIKKQEIRFVNF